MILILQQDITVIFCYFIIVQVKIKTKLTFWHTFICINKTASGSILTDEYKDKRRIPFVNNAHMSESLKKHHNSTLIQMTGWWEGEGGKIDLDSSICIISSPTAAMRYNNIQTVSWN